MDEDDRFNVVIFDPGGYWTKVHDDLSAQEAVESAKRLSDMAATRMAIHRIIITDSGDNTCFEWKRGEGVTFPT
jgi:hypothetical protein